MNKIDLAAPLVKERLKNQKELVCTSTITGEGIQELKNFLLQSIELVKITNDKFCVKDRHIDSLLKIRCSIEYCTLILTNEITYEQLLQQLYSIRYEFLTLIGKVYDKSILDIVFSKFCIGK